MRTNFHHHLLTQIEMLRGDISKEELSKKPDIGALRGFSGQRARKLMMRAANVWAKSEGIDLTRDYSVPNKNDARLAKNLYAGLKFFAQQQFNRPASEESAGRCC